MIAMAILLFLTKEVFVNKKEFLAKLTEKLMFECSSDANVRKITEKFCAANMVEIPSIEISRSKISDSVEIGTFLSKLIEQSENADNTIYLCFLTHGEYESLYIVFQGQGEVLSALHEEDRELYERSLHLSNDLAFVSEDEFAN